MTANDDILIAELTGELRAARAELSVINAIQVALAKAINLQEIYDVVGDQLTEIFNFQTVAIYSTDIVSGKMLLHYAFEKGQKLPNLEVPLNSLYMHVLNHGTTFVINGDFEEFAAQFKDYKVPQGEIPRSILVTPLKQKNDNAPVILIGLLDIDSGRTFTETDIHLIETVANAMGGALENARLLKETEERNAELAVINSVQEGLASQLDMPGIYKLVGDTISKITAAGGVFIAIWNWETRTMRAEYFQEQGEQLGPAVRPFSALHDMIFPEIEKGKTIVWNDGIEERFRQFGHVVAIGKLPKSLVFVPLKIGGKINSGIALQDSEREYAYSESIIRLVETLAGSMSVALENARLFDETQNMLAETAERNAELAIINAVQSALAGELDLQGIFSLVGDKLHEVFHEAQTVDILLYDPDTNFFTPKYVIEKGKRFELKPWHWKGFRKHIIESGEPLMINQDMAKAAKKFDNPVIVGEAAKSWMGTPMMVGRAVKGVISIQHIDKENAFRESDLRLLTTLANSLSVALENARLFDETQRLFKAEQERFAELQIINSIQQGLAAELDFQAIINLVGDKLRAVFDTNNFSIRWYDENENLVHYLYEFEHGTRLKLPPEPPASGGSFEHFLRDRQPIIGNTIEIMARTGGGSVPGTDTSKSLVSVPVIASDRVIGSLQIENYERENAFDESDLRLLTTIAASLGTALENARLFDVTQRLLKETEERNAELAVINAIQQGVGAELNFQTIIDLVGDKLREVLHTGEIGIRWYDYQNKLVHYLYEFEHGKRLTIPASPSKLGWDVITSLRAPMVRNTAEEVGEAGTIPGTDTAKSNIYISIIGSDRVLGSIVIEDFEQEYAFSEPEVRLLTTVASSMGVALENARLFDETQRLLELTEERNDELAIINTISQSLTQELDLQSLIDLVGDNIRAAVSTENIGIGLYDKDSNILSSLYVYRNGERVFPEPTPFNEFNHRYARQGKPLVLNNITEKIWNKLGSNLTFGNEIPKSVIMMPILAGGELIGGITLQNFEEDDAYPESMVRLLETVASNMGTAIQNARLFESERQRAAELTVISKLSQALVAEPELEKMIQLIGSQTSAIFKADIAYLALLKPQTSLVEFPYQHGDKFDPLPLGQGFTSTILRTGQPLLLNKDLDKHSSALGVSRSGKQAKSYLGVPIQFSMETIGVLSVQSTVEEEVFDDDDLRLLTTIAANAGAAIHTAQLHAETQRRAREMATLAEIGNDIASTHDLNTILEKIAERAKRLLQVGDIALYLMNETGDKVVPRVVLGEYVDQIMATPIPIGVGISGSVVKSGIAELVIDPSNHPNTIIVPGTPEIEEEPEGMMSAPLISGGKVIGLINVWRKHSLGLFSQSELDFLISVARQAAIAIESARLYLETEQFAEQMSTLESVGREISSDLDLQSVLERIGERALNLLQGKSVAIRLLDEQNQLVPVVALGEYADQYMNHKIRSREGITGDVVQTGKPEIINFPLQDKRLMLVPGTGNVESYALIVSPLMIADLVIGTLTIWRDKEKNGRFKDSDLGFALGLARQAAIAITNANLFKEVERQKEYFEALISSAPVAIITIGLDGSVTGWSPAAENLFGYSAEEAIGVNIDDLVANHEEIREEAELYTKKFLLDIGKIQLNAQRTHKNGQLIDVVINAMPVHIEGELSGYIAIYNDVSELEKARRDAEEANHAKSAFLANMSHELRTPLNAIIGFTRIVKRKGEKVLPEKQLENLEKVLVSSEHLLGLINTVLDISKIEAGKMEVHTSTFDLKSLVDLVLVTSQPLLRGGGVQLRKVVPDNLPMINSDIEKIKQVLINLVSNAAKFTHQGEIKVRIGSDQNQIIVDVIDTGIGISPEALEHIFEEFQQADSSTTRQYGGTGLGLSISKSLAKLLGGNLSVVSQVGIGSTFSFSFPIIYGQSETETPSEDRKPERMGTEPLILVIDDNPDASSLMQEILEGTGYHVAFARDGEEGLLMAKELNPFVITLDIMMPKKDGWQVLHALKSNPATKNIPVILISIINQKALGFTLGADDYLVKPLQEDEILLSLEKIRKQSGNQPLKKLLVVDDDPNVVDMISQLLEGKKYQVDSAFDGIDALEKIRTEKPDVLLLDLMMPRLDGFGLIDQIKHDPKLTGLPIIVLTADLLNDKEKTALLQTVGQVIQKQGMSGKDLLAEINKTIQKLS